MLSATIDTQAAERGITQRVLGQHALDSDLHRELRLLLHQDAILGLLQTAGPAGVMAIELLLALLAGQNSLGGVEHDDKVAAVNVGVCTQACACRAAGERRWQRSCPGACQLRQAIYHLRVTVSL